VNCALGNSLHTETGSYNKAQFIFTYIIGHLIYLSFQIIVLRKRCGQELQILPVSTRSAVPSPSCIQHACERSRLQESFIAASPIDAKSNASELLECAFWRAYSFYLTQFASTRKFILNRRFYKKKKILLT